jgi:4-hydroxyacetophenone monooxygenase
VIEPIPADLGDAALAEALCAANLPALLPALVHLTGDASLLDEFRSRVPGFKGDAGAGIPDDQAREIRRLALDVLRELRDGRRVPAAPPSDETLCAMMRWCAGQAVAPDYVPLLREESNFDGRDLRRFRWSRRPPAERLAGFRVGVIGAGLGGLCTAIRLEQAGIPYTIFEKNENVGGTWFENHYPGLRVDVANHFYSYSFEPNPDWSDYYACRDELQSYVERCARKYRLWPHIRFGTEVVAAAWDQPGARWKLRLRGPGGTEQRAEVSALVSAVGMLSRPCVPDIPGLASFTGTRLHSARWDDQLQLAGRRVAVIGTGASAMQIVPTIAEQVQRLLVFQRDPHWALPNANYHRRVDPGTRWLMRHVPYYGGWYRFLLFWGNGDRLYESFRIDPQWPRMDSINRANDGLRQIMTEHLEQELGGDPELIRKTLPTYPPLGKRILQDNGWYRTLTRDNVELITEPIRQIGPQAIATADGREHPVDVIVLATGFHPNKFLWPMEITGRSGTRLHDLWGEDPRAYLGITVPDYPNLFCMYGPNTNPVVGSVIFMLECQATYIAACLRELLERGLRSLECRREVHDAYNERLDAEHERLVWRHPRVHSYYNNPKGRVTTNVPWKLLDYWKLTRTPDLSDFIAR